MVLEAPERHEDEGERMDRMGQEGGRSWLSVTAGEVCVGVGAICFKRSQYTN